MSEPANWRKGRRQSSINKHRDKQRAKQRALRKLAKKHPKEFNRLVEEETKGGEDV
jgi:hypothetical protein